MRPASGPRPGGTCHVQRPGTDPDEYEYGGETVVRSAGVER